MARPAAAVLSAARITTGNVQGPEASRTPRASRHTRIQLVQRQRFDLETGKERTMRMRVLALGAVLGLAGACAHGNARSDTVSDDVLARVPPDRMAEVNQARND